MTLASRSPQRGYTLTELLVVVLIMVIMMALALPAVRRASEDARIREASRQVQAFFTMAKARAAATGRVAGVELVVQRGVNSSPFVTQLYLCEEPNYYGGATTTAAARVNGVTLEFSDTNDPAVLQTLIKDGDNFLIRFNYHGEWYPGLRSGSAFRLTSSGDIRPPTAYTPYQIRRLTQRVGNPSELPAGACLDFFYSGTGSATGPTAGHEFGALTSRLQILFSPAGHLEGFIGDTTIVPAGSPLYLLVGQTIKVGSRGQDLADPRNNSNLAEGTNLWVSVGRLTGAVATSENVVTASRDSVQADFLTDLRTARQFAINREQMKGK